MKTNYILRLQAENKALEARIAAILAEATDTEVYYSSAKFQGIDNDYAHVSTDVLPRLRAIKALTLMSDDEIAARTPAESCWPFRTADELQSRIYRGELEATDADGVTTMADLA